VWGLRRGSASWLALHDHMRAGLKIGAVKHTRDCTKVASEPHKVQPVSTNPDE
jgi:hypothetical protein